MIPPSDRPLQRIPVSQDPVLRLRGWWLGLAWFQVGMVCLLSLEPAPPDFPPIIHADKLGHVLAYFSLGAWFTALYPARPWRWWLGLLFLGVALEALQGGIIPSREASGADALANCLGVAAGAVFSARVWPGWLGYLDGFGRALLAVLRS